MGYDLHMIPDPDNKEKQKASLMRFVIIRLRMLYAQQRGANKEQIAALLKHEELLKNKEENMAWWGTPHCVAKFLEQVNFM